MEDFFEISKAKNKNYKKVDPPPEKKIHKKRKPQNIPPPEKKFICHFSKS